MKVLVVVDMQNDFITGSLGTEEAQKIVPKVAEKIKWARMNAHRVVFTQDTHSENYLSTPEGKALPIPHCIVNTEGFEIVPELLDGIDNPNIFRKSTFGSRILSSDLAFECFIDGHKFDEIIFIGVCTDICVISNALMLKTYMPGIQITVDASCCAGATPEMHRKALDVMKNCQINIINEGDTV